MSAKDQMAKMLDQLMGQHRDGSDGRREKSFLDDDVCRPFLLGICINELFVNTRAELPDCSKVHSLGLRDQFEAATRDYHIEEEVHDYLSNFIHENERKIEHAKVRLQQTQEGPEDEDKLDKIHELAVQIGEQVAKAESLGAQGDVDESLALLAKVEEIKTQKRELEDEYHSSIPRHSVQQQKLRACEVCGAFLSMYDNDRRLADHFGGKLHIGFVTIREKMKALEEIIKEKEAKRLKEREEYQKEREKRKRSRSRDRERGRKSRDRSRERYRDRSSDRRRSRSRDRDRRRDRDRDRDDYRRSSRTSSRDRDRDERRRSSRGSSRDRDRDRERSRRDRSRSRERNGRRERSRSR